MTATTEPPADVAGGRQRFDVAGHHLDPNLSTHAARQVLAAAHADRVRPACLCRPGGGEREMYIARLGADPYVVKRMPDTGMVHAPDCPSYLPPESLSGLGQVLGAAIQESADTGITALRLGLRMGKADRNAPTATGGGDGSSDSVSTDGTRLTLRAVLHYLWQEAGLATWSPGMTGKRNWASSAGTCARPPGGSSPKASRSRPACSCPSRSTPTANPNSPRADSRRGRPPARSAAPASS